MSKKDGEDKMRDDINKSKSGSLKIGYLHAARFALKREKHLDL